MTQGQQPEIHGIHIRGQHDFVLEKHVGIIVNEPNIRAQYTHLTTCLVCRCIDKQLATVRESLALMPLPLPLPPRLQA